MPSIEKIIERAASPGAEKRHWVRLTRACNNRCLFCLDSDCQDGTFIGESKVQDDILRGRKEGATRLILSGGEPTIHPKFTEIVAMAAKIGYRWVQAISNGRMFSYPRFAARAIEAGLNEVTVSIHGWDADSHDSQTETPGSFDQALRGIRNLLASGRCHVSVDVVMNRRNIDSLTEVVERLAGMGVREFDLLLIQPFGRAWENRSLLLDASHAPAIRKAARRAQELGCWVWTNRVPPEWLEGMEELIQDPAKLLDEIAGRRDSFNRCMAAGRLPDCRADDRCTHCVLGKYCLALFELLAAIGFDGKERRKPLYPSAVPLRLYLPLEEGTIENVKALLGGLFSGGNPETIELVGVDELVNWPRSVALVSSFSKTAHLSLRFLGSCPHDLSFLPEEVPVTVEVQPALLDRLLAFPESCRKLLILGKNLPPGEIPESIAGVRYVPFADITDEIEKGPELGFSLPYPQQLFVDVPPCLSGNRTVWPKRPVLSAGWFGEDLLPDTCAFARYFLEELNYTKGLRCKFCVHDLYCRGIHINYVRKFGYRVLLPQVQKGGESDPIQPHERG